MISAAAIQAIFFAIAFRITSCTFITRPPSAAGTRSGIFNFQNRRRFLNRTIHVLIGPDNSHASDRKYPPPLQMCGQLHYSVCPEADIRGLNTLIGDPRLDSAGPAVAAGPSEVP